MDDFNFHPTEYIESMGWSIKDFPRIEEIRGQLDFTREDVKEVAKAIPEDVTGWEDAIEAGLDDATVNFVAEKITQEYRKLKKED